MGNIRIKEKKLYLNTEIKYNNNNKSYFKFYIFFY